MIARKIAISSIASLTAASSSIASEVPYSWSGFYTGISVGGSFAPGGHNWSPAGSCTGAQTVCFAPGMTGFVPYSGADGIPYLPTTSMTQETAPTGWKDHFGHGEFNPHIGLFVGYKWQFASHIVLGFEDQFNLLGQQNSAFWQNSQNFGTYNSGYDSVAGTRSDRVNVSGGPRWVDILAPSLGYAQDRTLFYVKGGLALGSIGLSTQAASSETIYNSGYSTGSSTTDTVWAGHKNQMRAGYALGGGIEQALSDSVSLRVDGTYFDLGTTTATATGTTITTGTGSPPVPAGNGTAQSYSVSKKADGLLLSVGLNFRY